MTRQEMNELVEKLIRIKDMNDLTRSERDAINDACNLIDHNIHIPISDAKEMMERCNEAMRLLDGMQRTIDRYLRGEE